MIGQFEKEKEELESQLSNLQRERDNSLLMAENDKQQVIMFCDLLLVIYFTERRSLKINCQVIKEK